MPYCAPSTGVKTVPAICDRVSRSFCWISSLMRTQSHVFVCSCSHSNQHQLQLFKIPLSPSSLTFLLQTVLPTPFSSPPSPLLTWPVDSKLQFSRLPAEVPVMFRVVELPQKQHICKVKSLNKGDANSEVTVYYQVRRRPRCSLCSVASFHEFVSSCALVWAQGLEGAHADGAAGGE